MNKELKRNECLSTIYKIIYHSNPTLDNSGRYIKSLRQVETSIKDPSLLSQYDYQINKLLQQHIIFLQEALLMAKNKKEKIIPLKTAMKIKELANSQYKVNDGDYSLVDVDGLKKMKLIKKAVNLKENLVLPCKVRSENQQYKFHTQIIITKNNALACASGSFEYDYNNKNINHYTLLTKVGSGIKNNELMKMHSTNR